MALKQSAVSTRKMAQPVAYAAGQRVTAVIPIDITAAGIGAVTAVSDKIEVGYIPAGALLVGAELISEAIGAALTADVGLMTNSSDGEFGNQSNSSTVGSQILNDASINNTAVSAATIACVNLGRDETKHRAIGITVSGDIAAGAGKRLTLVLEYVQ
jgi:hypothetical protein